MKEENAHYKGHRGRLKKRYAIAGIDALHDYEILELLLGYAISRRDVKPTAKNLLRRFGSLKNLMDAEPEKIAQTPGIGPHSTLLIKLVKDMGTMYLREKATEKPHISSTVALLNYCKSAMGGLRDEKFAVIYLNTQNRIIKEETIQIGTVNQAVVYPRKILEGAINHKASAIILVHNHPSGNVEPSGADISLTKTIQDVAKVMDVAVHDHIIIGGNSYFSFREEGVLR